MHRPEIIAIPFLMLADYYLTLVGYILYCRGYRDHIRMESYELNPKFQNAINNRQWLNLRHLVFTVLITACVLYLDYYAGTYDFWPIECYFGFLFGMYAVIVARHISNILIFSHVASHPGGMQGQAVISYELSIRISQSLAVGTLFTIGILTWLQPTAFMHGALLGQLYLLIVHLFWLAGYRKKMRKAEREKAETPPEPEGEPR